MSYRKRSISKIGIFLGILIVFCLLFIVLTNFYEDFKKHQYPLPYYDIVLKYSDEFDIPIELIYAIMHTESSFDAKAVSHANAKGLMQLTDDTLDWITRYHLKIEGEKDIFDPEINIMVGTYYLRYAYNRYGNWDTVYASYNAGIGRVDSWLKDSRYSDDGITLRYVPYKETRDYIIKINDAISEYRELYFSESK